MNDLTCEPSSPLDDELPTVEGDPKGLTGDDMIEEEWWELSREDWYADVATELGVE